MLITIFTPSYNRGYIIEKLYQSLLQQTNMDFEWVVVNDGSTDQTDELFAQWISQDQIPITYIKTPNGGKQRATNIGVKEAKGELFFIVDSDDYLTDDAVAQIAEHWAKVGTDPHLAGLCFRCVCYNTGEFVGGPSPSEQGSYNSIELAYTLGLKGDKAEVFRTDILRQYPFPEIEGEKFATEAIVWFRIAKHYNLWLVNRGIYMCEYLDDGITRNIRQTIKKNLRGFKLYYREALGYKQIPVFVKVKCLVRLVQCTWWRWRAKR